MKNKVTVTIAQREYTLISDEGEAYVEKVASYVSGQIQDTMRTAGVSAVDAAVLAAAAIFAAVNYPAAVSASAAACGVSQKMRATPKSAVSARFSACMLMCASEMVRQAAARRPFSFSRNTVSCEIMPSSLLSGR